MKTFSAKQEEVERSWHLIDLDGQTLGRAATQIASLLRGKHKPIFTPHVDTGDFVVVINASKIVLTGNKRQQKLYRRYTGFIGGLRETTAEELIAKKPDEVILRAVKGMLPKNRLGRQIIKKLKIYAGPEHPHEAQQPTTYEL